MAVRVSLDPSTEILLASASSSIALPTASTDGVSIAVPRPTSGSVAGAWKENNQAHADAAVFIETSVATTLSAPLGLFGFRADTVKWYALGALNGGAAVTTPNAAVGVSTIIEFASIYSRLAIGPLSGSTAVTPGSGTVTVRVTMIRQVSGN